MSLGKVYVLFCFSCRNNKEVSQVQILRLLHIPKSLITDEIFKSLRICFIIYFLTDIMNFENKAFKENLTFNEFFQFVTVFGLFPLSLLLKSIITYLFNDL